MSLGRRVRRRGCIRGKERELIEGLVVGPNDSQIGHLFYFEGVFLQEEEEEEESKFRQESPVDCYVHIDLPSECE
jgi:hypothetical protein